jgi:SAM-dependent methyltransferase
MKSGAVHEIQSDCRPGWLTQPLGRTLLAAEQDVAAAVLEGVFGETLLQIGQWGPAAGFIRHARTQSALLASDEAAGSPDFVADLARLPVESESVDAIILPHTLDLAASPHAVLREAYRVLRSEGRMLIFGFKPVGLWGIRRLVPGQQFPPETAQLLGDRMLRDWLRLLNLGIQDHRRFFFRLPFMRDKRALSSAWEGRGQRWWPELAACYALTVRKRVAAITPVRPRWRERAKVVGGLVEPSMREGSRVVRLPSPSDRSA